MVETDDGFRIEIKGDKERLREMGFGKGMFPFPFGFGRMGHGPFQHHGAHGFGFPFGRRHAPWWAEGENPREEKSDNKV